MNVGDAFDKLAFFFSRQEVLDLFARLWRNPQKFMQQATLSELYGAAWIACELSEVSTCPKRRWYWSFWAGMFLNRLEAAV